MYQMSARTEIEVSANSSGEALVIIIPRSSTYSNAWSSTGFYRFPFLTLAKTSVTNPFASSPAINLAGPFTNQSANMSTMAVDSCSISYIHT